MYCDQTESWYQDYNRCIDEPYLNLRSVQITFSHARFILLVRVLAATAERLSPELRFLWPLCASMNRTGRATSQKTYSRFPLAFRSDQVMGFYSELKKKKTIQIFCIIKSSGDHPGQKAFSFLSSMSNIQEIRVSTPSTWRSSSPYESIKASPVIRSGLSSIAAAVSSACALTFMEKICASQPWETMSFYPREYITKPCGALGS